MTPGTGAAATEQLSALRLTRSLDINVLMTLAGSGAALIGEWAEGAVAIFLFAVGELLERYTMDRARGAIRALMDLSPPEARRLVDGREERVPLESLRVGDVVRLRPGERIPADGEVMAVFADMGASLLVAFNGMRLLLGE